MAQARISAQQRARHGGLGDGEVVRVRLLGGFEVDVGRRGVAHDLGRLRKAGALVKVLSLARRHGLHRGRITALLWPDLGARASSNNLHRALHVARTALGDPARSGQSAYLMLESNLVRLCPHVPLWVDVEAFEDAAAIARQGRRPAAYRAALDLYAGELLPGDRYEPWADARREELRRLRSTLLVELGHLHEERGEPGPAIEALQAAAAEEPADEGASAGLMRLYAACGRQHEALLQYERLRRALLEDLGARPTESARLLRDKIRAGETPEGPSATPIRQPAADGARADNLPAPMTSFVGRRRELVEVKRALAMTRLLTLTGAGGTGKTRLALEVARGLVPVHPDGVWLAELASVADPALVPRAVAASLGARERPDRPLTRALGEHLGSGRTLLVLDNCEHLVDAAASLAKELLGACPRLTVLATSREAMGLPGETVWPVQPLSLPDPKAEVSVGALMRTEAARLFVDRAASRLTDFELTPGNASAVARICHELDGIPLAIELSTARMGALDVGQVAERLAGSLGFLAGGDRMAVPRHRTLRATLDWSYDLLSKPERSLFERLSVFVGGCTLEAAEAVGAGRGIDKEDVLGLLSRLIDKSVVVARPSRQPAEGRRYAMLEPVRQYGLERLGASPEDADDARRRHASWFFGLAQEVEPWLRGGRQEAWLGNLEQEYGNLRAALDWTLKSGEKDLGLWFGAALAEFWYMGGHLGEGRRWLETALAGGGDATPARVRALARVGWIAWEQGDYESSVNHGRESLALARALADRSGEAAALSSLSWSALLNGDLGLASSLSEEAVGLGRAAGDAGGVARALLVPGLAAVVRRDYDRAASLQEESLRLAREAGDDVATALSLGTGVFTAIGRGDVRRAKALCGQAFESAPHPPVMIVTSFNLHAAAALAASQGHPVRSARLWGAAGSLRGQIGAAVSPAERRVYGPLISAARQSVGETAWSEAWAEGEAMTAEEASRYATEEGRAPQRRRDPGLEKAPVIRRPGRALTRREREVGTLISRGLTDRQISRELTISERTVNTHVGHILDKLGATSRTQVAAWMVEQRINPEAGAN